MRRIPLHVTRTLGLSLCARIQDVVPGLLSVHVVGSTRRWEPTCDGLSLVVALKPTAINLAICGEALHRLAPTRSPRLGLCVSHYYWQGYMVPVAIYLVSPLVSAAYTWWLTGSDSHRSYVQARARAHNLELTPMGMFSRFNNRLRIDVRTEDTIYGRIGLPVYPPEVRSNGTPAPIDLVTTTVCDSTRTEDLDAACEEAIRKGIRELRVRRRYHNLAQSAAFVTAINQKAAFISSHLRLKPELEVPVDSMGLLPTLPEGAYRVALFFAYRSEYDTDHRVQRALEQSTRIRVLLDPVSLQDLTLKSLATRGVAFDVSCDPTVTHESPEVSRAVALGVPITLSTATQNPQAVGHMTYGVYRARRHRARQRQVL